MSANSVDARNVSGTDPRSILENPRASKKPGAVSVNRYRAVRPISALPSASASVGAPPKPMPQWWGVNHERPQQTMPVVGFDGAAADYRNPGASDQSEGSGVPTDVVGQIGFTQRRTQGSEVGVGTVEISITHGRIRSEGFSRPSTRRLDWLRPSSGRVQRRGSGRHR